MTVAAWSGIDELRMTVRLFDHGSEDFAQRWTVKQLVQLRRMHLAAGWDFHPASWTARQVARALRNIPPTWDEDERPTYPRKLAPLRRTAEEAAAARALARAAEAGPKRS